MKQKTKLFLDELIEMGPEISRSSIRLKLLAEKYDIDVTTTINRLRLAGFVKVKKNKKGWIEKIIIHDRPKTQNEAILEHLKRGLTITPLESLKLYKCFRLAARISELRCQGHKIKSKLITKNRKKYAEYQLV
jgi:hypothetical protein